MEGAQVPAICMRISFLEAAPQTHVAGGLVVLVH